VCIALGTSLAIAGSREAFDRIDRQYPLKAARAAKCDGKPQRLVYLSSGGASSGSWVPYLKSKGLTEEGLLSIGYEEFLVFRPGPFKDPPREGTTRAAEKSPGWLRNTIYSVLPTIEVPILAKSIVAAGQVGKEGVSKLIPEGSVVQITQGREFVAVDNTGANKLGEKAQTTA